MKLYKGDCLIESDKIESGSVDLILTDLPYGNMNTDGGRKLGINGWDLAIEPKKVYEIANRILRKNGKMILFSQEPYTTKLISEAIANVPFGLVQSAGRPDLTAKLHMIELPFYLLVLWWLLNTYGIVGVALAWLLRVAVDTTVLFVMANRLVSTVSGFTLRMFYTAGIALSCLALGALIPGLTMKWLFLLLILTLFTVITWFFIFSTNERDRIRNC